MSDKILIFRREYDDLECLAKAAELRLLHLEDAQNKTRILLLQIMTTRFKNVNNRPKMDLNMITQTLLFNGDPFD